MDNSFAIKIGATNKIEKWIFSRVASRSLNILVTREAITFLLDSEAMAAGDGIAQFRNFPTKATEMRRTKISAQVRRRTPWRVLDIRRSRKLVCSPLTAYANDNDGLGWAGLITYDPCSGITFAGFAMAGDISLTRQSARKSSVEFAAIAPEGIQLYGKSQLCKVSRWKKRGCKRGDGADAINST